MHGSYSPWVIFTQASIESRTLKSLLPHLSIAAVGHVLEKAIALIVVTVLVHHVDKALMGKFFFAISVCTAAALVNEFGTSRYLVRAIAQDRHSAAAYLGGVLRLRLPLLALTVITINGIVAVVAPELVWIFIFTSFYILFENLYYAFGSTLMGVGAVSARVITGLTGPLLLLILVPATTLLGWSFHHIVIMYAAATTVMAAVAFIIVVRRIGPVTIFGNAAPVRSIIAQCSLLFAVNVVLMLHSKVDEWMLAAMRDFRDVAGYAAAYKLAEVSRTVIRPITMVLFPLFAAAAAKAAWDQVRTHARNTLLTAALFSAVVAVCVIGLAPWIVPLLFGRDYPETVAITRVLFLAAPALFVGQVAMLINSSLHLDKETLGFAVAAVLLNVGLNLIAIPRWGATGAAWVTLTSESLLAICLVTLLTFKLRAPATRAASAPASVS
jgi:O-antigen/teichoic acid export membrane protein